MNNQWLRHQVTNFIDKPVNHNKYMKDTQKRKSALAARGFTLDDFSKMIGVIHNERKAPQEPQEAEQPTQGNETITAETARREPVRPINDTRKSNASGVKVKPSKYTGPSILDMADERSKK